jgi:small subunit ribosomal protein S20
MADVRTQKKMKQGRHASAQKRARQSLKHKARNQHNLSTMRSAMKKVRTAVAAKNKEAAAQALKIAVPVIAKTAVKGSTHRRTAARYISRLTLAVNSL